MNGIYLWLLRAAIAVIASLTINATMRKDNKPC